MGLTCCAGRSPGDSELQMEVGGTRRGDGVYMSCARRLRWCRGKKGAQRRRSKKVLWRNCDAEAQAQGAKVTAVHNKRDAWRAGMLAIRVRAR
ncbi:hypothetical protein IG631_02603 [Alternaria alternata]|nr:hypothetical protein IG631_02603 [Alternaria alternata]